jgi:hypothetical protein
VLARLTLARCSDGSADGHAVATFMYADSTPAAFPAQIIRVVMRVSSDGSTWEGVYKADAPVDADAAPLQLPDIAVPNTRKVSCLRGEGWRVRYVTVAAGGSCSRGFFRTG